MSDFAEYPFPAHDVFNALCHIIQSQQSFKISRINNSLYRIELKKPTSLTTWGFSLVITVTPESETVSKIQIETTSDVLSIFQKQQQQELVSNVIEGIYQELCAI